MSKSDQSTSGSAANLFYEQRKNVIVIPGALVCLGLAVIGFFIAENSTELTMKVLGYVITLTGTVGSTYLLSDLQQMKSLKKDLQDLEELIEERNLGKLDGYANSLTTVAANISACFQDESGSMATLLTRLQSTNLEINRILQELNQATGTDYHEKMLATLNLTKQSLEFGTEYQKTVLLVGVGADEGINTLESQMSSITRQLEQISDNADASKILGSELNSLKLTINAMAQQVESIRDSANDDIGVALEQLSGNLHSEKSTVAVTCPNCNHEQNTTMRTALGSTSHNCCESCGTIFLAHALSSGDISTKLPATSTARGGHVLCSGSTMGGTCNNRVAYSAKSSEESTERFCFECGSKLTISVENGTILRCDEQAIGIGNYSNDTLECGTHHTPAIYLSRWKGQHVGVCLACDSLVMATVE